MEEDESNNISGYNEANLQIMRLHEIWLRCEEHSRRGNLIQWKFELDIIWRELWTDAKKHKTCNELLQRNFELVNAISQCKNKIPMYHALDNRHRFLKELQDLAGKGSKYIDASIEDFE